MGRVDLTLERHRSRLHRDTVDSVSYVALSARRKEIVYMDYVDQRLMSVIALMRETCDDAERIIKDTHRSNINKAAQVMHTFSWGWANASTGIESALNQVEREIEI